jgi:glycogen synthase
MHDVHAMPFARRRRRVLMTADAADGLWTYAQTLTAALAAHDVDITVAVMGPPPGDARVRTLLARGHVSLVHRPYRLEWMPNADGDLAAAGRWLLALARRVQPDVVHVNGYAHAALPFECPVLVAAHSCVCSWWRAVRGERAPDDWSAYRARVADGLDAAAIVVAPTQAMLDALDREHDYDGPATIISNGITPRRPAPENTEGSGKRQYVLAAGRLWDDATNLATLDRAADGLSWPVCAAGSLMRPDGSSAAPAVMCALDELEPGSLHVWMDRAAIFAHPARYEPFGLAPLEAARAGCALVLGDIPSLREVWGDAAVYVDPASAGDLRRALQRLIADAPRRLALGLAAERLARCYSAACMARAYADLYAELTGPRFAAVAARRDIVRLARTV